MKQIALILFAAIALAACQTTGGAAPSVADAAARICPPVKAVLVVLENSPTVDTDLQTALREVEPAVTIACSPEAIPSTASLHDLTTQALPVLIKAVAAAPLSEEQKNYAILSLAIAQAVIESVPK